MEVPIKKKKHLVQVGHDHYETMTTTLLQQPDGGFYKTKTTELPPHCP